MSINSCRYQLSTLKFGCSNKFETHQDNLPVLEDIDLVKGKQFMFTGGRHGSRFLKWGVNFCNSVIEPINILGIRKKKRKKETQKKGGGG